MPRLCTRSLVPVVILFSLAPISNLHAAGALAWAYETQTYGTICEIVANRRTLTAAEDDAMRQCQDPRSGPTKLRDACQVRSYRNECGACAWVSSGKGFGRGIARTSRIAIAQAVSECDENRKGNGLKCVHRKRECDGSAR
jgi:hypothetical protein